MPMKKPPPHKEISNGLASHRMEMVKLATAINKKFEVSDIEYNSNNTSYSIITVKKIKQLYNIKDRVNFIIGTDAFAKLNTWYKAEELKTLVHFIVFPRKGDKIEAIREQLKKDNWDFEITNTEYIDISSTEVRNGTSDNINEKVKDYIKNNELYLC